MSSQKSASTEEAADSGNYPSAAGNPQVDGSAGRPNCQWSQPENAIFLPIERKSKTATTAGSKTVRFKEISSDDRNKTTSREQEQFEVATAGPVDQTNNPDAVVEGGKDALSGQTALAEEDERLATHPFLHYFLDEIAENHYIIRRINSPRFVAWTTLLLVTSCVAVAGQVHHSTTPFHFSVFVHLLTGVAVAALGRGYYKISVDCRRVLTANTDLPKYQELFRLARLGERFQLFMVVAFYPALAFSASAFNSCEQPSTETDMWNTLQCSLPIFGVTIFLQCIPLLIFRMRVVLCLPLIALPALIFHISRSIVFGTEEDAAYQTAKFVVEGTQTLVFMMVAWVVEKFHRKRFVAWIAYRRSERLASVYRESLNSILELLLPPQCLKQLVLNQPAIDVAENSTISVCQVNDFCVWSAQVMPLVAVEVMDRVWSSFDLILHKNSEWRRQIRRLVATGDQFVCCLGLREAGTSAQQGDTPSASYNKNVTEGVVEGEKTLAKESTRGIVQFAIEQRRTIRHFLRSDAVSAMVQPFQATIALATGHSVGAIMGTDRLVYGVQGPALKTANKLARVAAHGTVLADSTTTARAGALRTRPFTATNSSISDSLVRQMRHCSVIVGLASDDPSTSASPPRTTTDEETKLLGTPSDAVSPARVSGGRRGDSSPLGGHLQDQRTLTPYRDSTTPWSTGGTDQPGLSGRGDTASTVGLDHSGEVMSNTSSLQEFVQFQQQRGIGLNPDARQAAQMRLQELTFGTRRRTPDSWYDHRFVSQRMESDLWKFAITHANFIKLAFEFLLWTVTYAGVLITSATDESLSLFGLTFLFLSGLWGFFGRHILIGRFVFGNVEKLLNVATGDAAANSADVSESPNGSLTGTTALRPSSKSQPSSPLMSPKGSLTRHVDKISSTNSNKDIFGQASKKSDESSTEKKSGGDSPPEGSKSSGTKSPGTLGGESGSTSTLFKSSGNNQRPLETMQKDVVPERLMKTITALIVPKGSGPLEFNYNQQLFIRPVGLLVQLTLFSIALAIGTATPMHGSRRGQQLNDESAILGITAAGGAKTSIDSFNGSILGTSFQFEFLLCCFLMYWHVTGEYVWYHGSAVMFIGATFVSGSFLTAAYLWGSEDAFYNLLMQMPLAWAALPVYFSALFQRERERRNSFCDSAFTEANFAIAEAELEINRSLMKILLPKFVVEAVLKKQRGAIYNSVVHSLQEAIALEVRLPAFPNSSVIAGAEFVRKASVDQLYAQDSFTSSFSLNSSGLGLSSGALLSSHGTSVTSGGTKTREDLSKFVDDVANRKSQTEFLGAGYIPPPAGEKTQANGTTENVQAENHKPADPPPLQKIDLLLEKALLSFNLVESALKWATEKDEEGAEAVGDGLSLDTANADLTILHIIGDSVMLAGPLTPPPKVEAPKPEKTDRCVLRDDADAQEKEKKQTAAGDIAVVKSAIAALKVLVWLENQVPGQVTGVCVSAVGYASVVGRNHPTFALMGGAPRLANALTSASPVGFLGATEAFLTLLRNHGVDLSLLRVALGLRQSWRIRGSGITGVLPLRIAVGDEEVVPDEDGTILAVSAAIEQATSGAASGSSQISLGDGSIMFASATGPDGKRAAGGVSSIGDMSFSPPARPILRGGESGTGSSSQNHTSASEVSQEIEFNYCPKGSTPTNGSFAPITQHGGPVSGIHEPPAMFPPHPPQQLASGKQSVPTPDQQAPLPVSCLFPAHPARVVDADGNAFQLSAIPQQQVQQQQQHDHQPQQSSQIPPNPTATGHMSNGPFLTHPARPIPLEAFSSSSTRFPMGPKLQSIPKWNPRGVVGPQTQGGGQRQPGIPLFPPHPSPSGTVSSIFPAHPPQNSQPMHQAQLGPQNSIFPPHAATPAVELPQAAQRRQSENMFPTHPPRAF